MFEIRDGRIRRIVIHVVIAMVLMSFLAGRCRVVIKLKFIRPDREQYRGHSTTDQTQPHQHVRVTVLTVAVLDKTLEDNIYNNNN